MTISGLRRWGRAFLDMLGVFAEFETNLRRKRQLGGIRAAKAWGVCEGRKPSIDPAEVRRLREQPPLAPPTGQGPPLGTIVRRDRIG